MEHTLLLRHGSLWDITLTLGEAHLAQSHNLWLHCWGVILSLQERIQLACSIGVGFLDRRDWWVEVDRTVVVDIKGVNSFTIGIQALELAQLHVFSLDLNLRGFHILSLHSFIVHWHKVWVSNFQLLL